MVGGLKILFFFNSLQLDNSDSLIFFRVSSEYFIRSLQYITSLVKFSVSLEVHDTGSLLIIINYFMIVA